MSTAIAEPSQATQEAPDVAPEVSAVLARIAAVPKPLRVPGLDRALLTIAQVQAKRRIARERIDAVTSEFTDAVKSTPATESDIELDKVAQLCARAQIAGHIGTLIPADPVIDPELIDQARTTARAYAFGVPTVELVTPSFIREQAEFRRLRNNGQVDPDDDGPVIRAADIEAKSLYADLSQRVSAFAEQSHSWSSHVENFAVLDLLESAATLHDTAEVLAREILEANAATADCDRDRVIWTIRNRDGADVLSHNSF